VIDLSPAVSPGTHNLQVRTGHPPRAGVSGVETRDRPTAFSPRLNSDTVDRCFILTFFSTLANITLHQVIEVSLLASQRSIYLAEEN
jgi:hypothetical protein